MNTSAAPDTPRTKTRKLLADCYQCKQSIKKLLSSTMRWYNR